MIISRWVIAHLKKDNQTSHDIFLTKWISERQNSASVTFFKLVRPNHISSSLL